MHVAMDFTQHNIMSCSQCAVTMEVNGVLTFCISRMRAGFALVSNHFFRLEMVRIETTLAKQESYEIEATRVRVGRSCLARSAVPRPKTDDASSQDF